MKQQSYTTGLLPGACPSAAFTCQVRTDRILARQPDGVRLQPRRGLPDRFESKLAQNRELLLFLFFFSKLSKEGRSEGTGCSGLGWACQPQEGARLSVPWQRFRRLCLAPCCSLSSSIRPPRRRRPLPQAGRGRGRRCSRSFACESRLHRPAARLRRAARRAAAVRTTLEARGRRLPVPPCRSAAAARSR